MKSDIPLFMVVTECLQNVFYAKLKNELTTKYVMRILMHPAYNIEPQTSKSRDLIQSYIDLAIVDIQCYAEKRLKKLEKEI